MMIEILENESEAAPEALNLRDDNGFTPFLFYIKEFVSCYSKAFEKVYKNCKSIYFKDNKIPERYESLEDKFSNEMICDPVQG